MAPAAVEAGRAQLPKHAHMHGCAQGCTRPQRLGAPEEQGCEPPGLSRRCLIHSSFPVNTCWCKTSKYLSSVARRVQGRCGLLCLLEALDPDDPASAPPVPLAPPAPPAPPASASPAPPASPPFPASSSLQWVLQASKGQHRHKQSLNFLLPGCVTLTTSFCACLGLLLHLSTDGNSPSVASTAAVPRDVALPGPNPTGLHPLLTQIRPQPLPRPFPHHGPWKGRGHDPQLSHQLLAHVAVASL